MQTHSLGRPAIVARTTNVMKKAVFSVRSVPSWESRRLVWDAEQVGSTVTD
jgi:hypothetical protein